MNDFSIDQLYAAHLTTLMQRTDRSLAATGFDALVIHAGRPPLQFLDDQDYPFKVNPQFKAWVPIVDNPRCVLVYSPGAPSYSAVLPTQRFLAQTRPVAAGVLDRRRGFDRHGR